MTRKVADRPLLFPESLSRSKNMLSYFFYNSDSTKTHCFVVFYSLYARQQVASVMQLSFITTTKISCALSAHLFIYHAHYVFHINKKK